MANKPYKLYACKFEYKERNPRFTEQIVLSETNNFYIIKDDSIKDGKRKVEKFWLKYGYHKTPKEALEEHISELNQKIKRLEEWKTMIHKEYIEKYGKEE